MDNRPVLSESRILEWMVNAPRSWLLAFALVTLAGTIWLDWREPGVSLGVIYVVPMLPAALALGRGPILVFALILTLTRAAFLPAGPPLEILMRSLLAASAYSATGLLVVELVRGRLLALEQRRALEAQVRKRLEAETHLRALAESSPAAIFTLDESGLVLTANRATQELFAGSEETVVGQSIQPLLPALAAALQTPANAHAFRTAVQSEGRRLDGSTFVAHTWFSTYTTPIGRRLAAIAVDISEETREREEENLRQLGANQRIVAAAMSHEIRNVCSAIQLAHGRLARVPGLASDADYRALGELVEALGNISSTELAAYRQEIPAAAGLADILGIFRILAEPDWQAAGGSVVWRAPAHLPLVLGQSSGILQALINLAQNSLRVAGPAPKLEVTVELGADRVLVILQDSGPGVADPQALFQPFRSGTGQTGLGLHISRANLRSYGGDLRYEASPRGARFVLELALARQWEMTA